MSKQTQFFTRNFNEITDRLDENYNDPLYDKIDELLAKSKYTPIRLGISQDHVDSKYLIRISSGKTPKNIRYSDEYEIPFIGARSIRDEKVDLSVAPKIKKEIHETVLKSSQTKTNDVLITMAGYYIGRCAVYEDNVECNANQAVAILTVNDKEINPSYLAKYFNSVIGQLFFGKLQHVSSQPNINLDEIVRIPIILPSRTQQDSILQSLSEMENQVKNLDISIQKFEEKENNLILKEIGIDISTEDLSYFFKMGKQKQSPYFIIPANSISDRLNFHHFQPKLELINKFKKQCSTTTLCSIVKKSIIRGDQPKYADDGIIVIKTVDLTNRAIDYESCLLTTKSFFDTVPNAHLKKNDILVSSTGYISIGKVNIYDKDDDAMADGHVSIIRLIDGYDPYFIMYFLRSHLGMIQFEKWWTGSSGQIEVQPTDLNNFVIPDNSDAGIPLKIQLEISNKLRNDLKQILKLEDEKTTLRLQVRNKFEKMIFNR